MKIYGWIPAFAGMTAVLAGCGDARSRVYSGTLELTEHSVGARVAPHDLVFGALERADELVLFHCGAFID